MVQKSLIYIWAYALIFLCIIFIIIGFYILSISKKLSQKKNNSKLEKTESIQESESSG